MELSPPAVAAFWAELQKLAAQDHWRKLKPGQTGHDPTDGKIKGKTWVDRKPYAKGIPKKGTHPVRTVSKPEKWRFVVQNHPAVRAGEHRDIRLGDVRTGHGHSWATKKHVPKPGEPPVRIYRTNTHSISYFDFEGELKGKYGRTKKGQIVKALLKDKIEVLQADPDFIRFNIYQGQSAEEFILTKKKNSDNAWHLINVTKTSARLKHIPFHKPKYGEIGVDAVDFNDADQVMAAKLDGGHVIYELNAGRRPRVYSYRKPKNRKTGVIEHSHKLEKLYSTIVPKSLKRTILRGEVYAKAPNGKPLAPERIAGMLNAGVWKSRRLQAEHGHLVPAIFDVVMYNGKDMTGAPYREKLKVMKELKKTFGFELADVAFTPAEKKALLKRIKSGKHPQTDEGVILWGGKKPVKAKFKSDHDVYIRQVIQAKDKNGKPKAEMGALAYSHTPNGAIVGKVGTGFSRALRQDVWKSPAKYNGAAMKLTAQTKYSSGALGKAAFQGWHVDKNSDSFWNSIPVEK
jgi:hypothetical protein